MPKAELKTKKNTGSVTAFLNAIKDPQRKKDSLSVLKIMKEVTGERPMMWGSSIVGFGSYHYKYASGREGDWMATGFSPRKQALTIYIMPGYQDYTPLLQKLGPHTHAKSCLYIKKLDAVHVPTLKQLIRRGLKDLKKQYS